MAKVGIDQFRSGCWDMVERKPRDGRPVEINWGNTKDFWQQEQAILAYLILHGYTCKPEYLQLAQEMEAFWNLFFLDRDRWGVFFRLTANGVPVIEGEYGKKGGRDVAGYHAFELNYLAHTYNRAFRYRQRREDNVFCSISSPMPTAGRDRSTSCPTSSRPAISRSSGLSSMAYAGPTSTPISSRSS